jgi:hypothetical protein
MQQQNMTQEAIVHRPIPVPNDMPDNFDSEQAYQRFQQEQEAMAIHLTDTAAAITIQAVARGWLVRRQFHSIFYLRASMLETAGRVSGEPWSRAPSQEGADVLSPGQLVTFGSERVQERILRKFRAYCVFHDKLHLALPDFPTFASCWFQGTYRMFVARSVWRRYKSAVCLSCAWRNILYPD